VTHELLRIAKTETNVLVSNLRSEVGEVITTWLILRHFMGKASKLRTDDPRLDISNKELAFLCILTEKLRNELIANLAELGDKKIGRTNFYFASRKLQKFAAEANQFAKFVIAKKLRLKRNQEIAHREQPERWFDGRPILIPYSTVVKTIAMALRLMKRIDRAVLGPSAPYLWREARKKRDDLMTSPSKMYLLLPYLHLSGEDRINIVAAEQAEGKVVWSEIETQINGRPMRMLVNKEWGLLLLGSQCVPLPQYPLQKLESICFDDQQDA